MTTPLPVGDDKTRRVRAMFDTIAPRYEFVNHIMTFGLDRRWRRRCVREMFLPPHSRILDVAAGTGDFCRDLIAAGHRPVATDLSFGMLSAGRGGYEAVHADASALPFRDGSFDGLTCGYALRNFTDLAGTFHEMARVVRPGGRLSIIEVAEPSGGIWRWGFNLWFRRCVPLIGGLLSDRAAYSYLPKSTAYLPDTETLRALLVEAGFSGVNHRMILGGLSQVFSATRAS